MYEYIKSLENVIYNVTQVLHPFMVIVVIEVLGLFL